MRPQVVVNAFVERFEGNLAIISVGNQRLRLANSQILSADSQKKYLILLRRFMPTTAREGLSLQIRLGRDGIRQASPDLEKTIKEARLFNEVMDYMTQIAVEN